jgi:hypothetical protein
MTLIAVQNGGYRAAAVASDHHVARSAFQTVSEPSAEYEFLLNQSA